MKNLNPYVPGEQPKDRGYVKLNANENPYPPCSAVQEKIADFVRKNPMRLSVYPDPDSLELHSAIASLLNSTGGVLCRTKISGTSCEPSDEDRIPFPVTPDMIYSGNGSDEVLSFVFYAFFGGESPLVLPSSTYSFYPVYAGFYGIPLDAVPMRADLSIDVDEMVLRAQRHRGGLIFANPNAPSGLSLSRDLVRSMLEKLPNDRVVVVDEAYCDFGGESCIPLLKDFKNLVVVRTFSKSLCAAGLRLGYIVADPELVAHVTTVKNSMNHFPIDAVAQVAGVASCENPWYYADCAKKIVAERRSFLDFLESKGWEAIESRTNFVLAKKRGMSGKDVYRNIKEQGILVRHFPNSAIEDYVRITIGTAAQMDALKKAIDRID